MNIEELNKEIRICEKCRLAGSRINVLCGEGKLNARLMLIAQAPGEYEDREGRMFIGPSGKVLDELLHAAGISREEIYMTNLLKCMLPKYRRPKQDEIIACSQYLAQEIEIINPQVLVPMGYYACKHLFEKYSISIPSRTDFAALTGKLIWQKNQKIFPLAHPAALLYKESLKKFLKRDYARLKVLKKDCKWYPLCPMKRFLENGKLKRKWIELYCKGDWESCIRYQMEERGEYHPDCMLPDGTIDEKLRGL